MRKVYRIVIAFNQSKTEVASVYYNNIHKGHIEKKTNLVTPTLRELIKNDFLLALN